MKRVMKKNAGPMQTGDEFEHFFKMSLDMLCIAGFDGYFKRLNPAWEKTLGFSRKELMAKPYLSFVHAEDRESTAAEAQKLTTGRDTISFENRYLSKDGNYKWFLWNAVPSSKQPLIYAVARDITERKRAELAVQAAQGELEARVKERTAELDRVNVELRSEVQRRSQVEEAVQKEKIFLRAIIENMEDEVVAVDSEGVVTLSNRTAHEAVGRVRIPVGANVWNIPGVFYLPDGTTLMKKEERPILRVLQGQPVHNQELTVVLENGLLRTLLASGRALVGPQGEKLGAVLVTRDITERKRAEEALRESEERFRRLVELMPVAVYECDASGIIQSYNHRAMELWGREPKSGDTAQRFCGSLRLYSPNGKFVPHQESPTAEVLRTGIEARNLELVMERPDGSHITVVVNIVPLRNSDGELIGAINCFQDITDRKRVEADRARLVLALEHAGDCFLISETDGTIIYVNPAFERVTGYSRPEVIGKNPRLLKSGKHDEGFYRAMWSTLTSGEVWSGRFINRRKDGALYEAEAVISPMRDDAGQVINYVAAQRDVTHEMQLEKQLLQAQKMEAVGRLAGGVAHDFNNLLTIITGYSELLMDQLEPNDTRRSHVEEVKEAAHRAASLTRQLLAFSRKQVLEPQVLDLNTVVANLEKMLPRLIGEDIELVSLLQPGLDRVKADPGQLEQVIMNLAVNARDAMPQGGKLTIETANVDLDEAYIQVHVAIAPGPYVMLAVSDTGIGMDSATQARIFEPFFTTKEKGKGTGLGLAMVYGIVKQSGGYIWVYSEPGQGTTFKIYLPRVEASLEPVERRVVRGRPARGSETILIVEDEEQLRNLVRQVLEANGYQVLEAKNGEQALTLLEQRQGPIHLLLTDVVMPDMSGGELAKRLRPVHQDMKVLFMSGYTDDAIVHHGVLELGLAFLQKPFSPEALTRKVREVLDAESKK